jgi:hypothetical protein
MLVCSSGAILILRTISERDVFLFGNPSGEVPLYALPWRPAGSSPKNMNGAAQIVDYAAHYCAELLEHRLIEPMTKASERGDRRFRVSESGQALLLDLAKGQGK